MSKPIIRAIDVGYGNTKFTVLRQGPSEIHCGVFPSIAPQASSMPDLAGDLFQRRNTAIVEANGVRFEVGTDAMLAKDASYGRTLDDAFCTTRCLPGPGARRHVLHGRRQDRRAGGRPSGRAHIAPGSANSSSVYWVTTRSPAPANRAASTKTRSCTSDTLLHCPSRSVRSLISRSRKVVSRG